MSEAVDELDARAKRLAKKKRQKAASSANKVASLKKNKPSRRIKAETINGADSLESTSPWKGFRVGMFLLALCVALGAQSAYQSQRMRALYSELQQDQVAQDDLLAQRSRLLIERGAMNSYNGTEKIASEELDMRFPEKITRVVVRSSTDRTVLAEGQR